MVDIERQFADRHRIAIVEPAVRFENLPVNPVFVSFVVKATDPEPVGFVWPYDADAEFLRQRPRFTAMVDMAVGDQDLFDRDTRLRRGSLQPGQITARIDERPAHRRSAPQERAILLEGRNRDDGGAHRGRDCHTRDMAFVSGRDKRRRPCSTGSP
jgi:hypothetical protein